jgi:hypothetical protein
MQGAELRIPGIWKFIIKYVSPLFLIVVFVFWCKDNLPDRIRALGSPEQQVPLLSVCLLGVLTVFLLILIHLASRRWNGTPAAAIEARAEGAV